MKRPPVKGAREDVGSVPANVRNSSGMRPHVRARLGFLARECVRSAEAREKTGAALALLSALADLGVRSGGVDA
ncbi:hypothetical protein SAMN04488058_1153 [Deinococcus reticulitermitis]|uniref:Uncharacterized protein n=1 Tax=Deinococcus reticulitermitis TaxID=856736 RepID=A0A1H7AXR2_9DEIO|nr:hypothetical protein [Deinococcus reticulitermitis]SEJ70048.1 hypothetical protein SAMN04488058_1153 [Deinococcus reticulitermitis]